MTPTREVVFWGLLALAVFGFVFVFEDILLPFVAGWFLAYLFTPVVRRLEIFGVGHAPAVVLITLFFILAIVATTLLILPALVNQLLQFLEWLPGQIQKIEMFVRQGDKDEELARFLGMDVAELQKAAQDLVGEGASWLIGIVDEVWTGGQAVISLFALIVVTPVIAFYLLLDWNKLTATLDSALPRASAPTVRRLLAEMDHHVGGFVHGQFVVGLVLGTYYAAALLIVGLDRALLIGFLAGLISFIPYLGSTTGFLMAVGVAIGQFWPDYFMIALVAGIFLFGQFVEGNVLQPRLVGNRVGLHPVLLIFALFAFGALFGFAGLLIAVPAAAAIAVLVRYAFERYRASPYYAVVDASTGPAAPDPAGEAARHPPPGEEKGGE